MPQVVNSKGETFDVTDVDAVSMTQADPSLKIVGDIRTSNAAGDAPVSMAAGQVTSQEGLAPASAKEQAAFSRKVSLKDKTSTIGSAARGALSGASFGLTDGLFDEDQTEALASSPVRLRLACLAMKPGSPGY